MGIEEAILNEVETRGIEQGIEKKERQVVELSWKKGLSIQDIAEITALSIEKVQAIIDNLIELSTQEDSNETNEETE